MMLVDSSSSKKSSKNKKKRKSTQVMGGMVEKKVKETTLKRACFHYGQDGHWKRNYKAYLESEKNVACDVSSTSGNYVIEVNTTSQSNQWVLDTSYGSHICIDIQGLRNSRKLTKRESDLWAGNGAKVTVVAMGTYVLYLPSGLCLNLDDCFYVPALIKNIIPVYCLNK